MKRLLLTPILLLFSVGAFADSVTISLSPNDGGGDNFGFFEQGNGFKILIEGGTPFDFFNSFGYAPGSTIGGSSDVFFDNGNTITINGTSFEIADYGGPGQLFISPFALPTNDKNFSIMVTATFSASAILLDGTTFNINASAPGKMTFEFDPISGKYAANSVVFTTVPEPSTFASLGTGLLAILALTRRLTTRRPPTPSPPAA